MLFRAQSHSLPRGVAARAAPRSAKRRDLVGAIAVAPLVTVGSARALIPDDDDEELVEKAKANRQAKLQQDKEANRKYVGESGLRDRSIENSLVPIQTAVYKLAKVGESLEKDDAKAAAATLKEAWADDFASAGDKIAKTPDSKAKLDLIVTAIKGATEAAGAGNAAGAKIAFVGAVEAIENWADTTGIATQLKGL